MKYFLICLLTFTIFNLKAGKEKTSAVYVSPRIARLRSSGNFDERPGEGRFFEAEKQKNQISKSLPLNKFLDKTEPDATIASLGKLGTPLPVKKVKKEVSLKKVTKRTASTPEAIRRSTSDKRMKKKEYRALTGKLQRGCCSESGV